MYYYVLKIGKNGKFGKQSKNISYYPFQAVH